MNILFLPKFSSQMQFFSTFPL